MNPHYYNRYLKLIEYRKNNIPNKSQYCERHHIIPKSMGGNNEKENLVFLTGREHYIAHYLLAKSFPENSSLWYSFNMMRRICNSKSFLYEKTRIYISENLKKDKKRAEKISKANTGKSRSKEQKQKQSLAMSGENNPNWGKNHSIETKEKMSKNGIKGRKICYNEKTGKNIYVRPGELIPNGFLEGAGPVFLEKAKNRKKATKWIRHIETGKCKRIGEFDDIPEGYEEGRTPLPKKECCGKLWDPGNYVQHRKKKHPNE
jgi:hypothetical protein